MGLDFAIASLLANPTDILLSAIGSSSGPTTGPTTTQTGTSQLYVNTPSTGAPAVFPSSLLTPVPSTQTQLSSVAQTLVAISRFGGETTPPLTGDTPLWPSAPVPASAFASLSESIFSSRGATAADGVDTPAPPLDANELAGTLAKTVDESGLFYEAHLVQWFSGQRPLASVASEPQARAGTPDSDLPSSSSSSSPSSSSSSGFSSLPSAGSAESAELAESHPALWVDETLLTNTAPRTSTDPNNPVRLVQMPMTPQQAASLAASVRGISANAFTSTSTSTLTSASPGTAGSASAAQGRDPAVQASIAAGIDPSTIPLVRQQLDLLATNQFRWSGEAWPGAKFDWEIEPHDRASYERDAGGAGDADRAWRTRVTLSLPTLGNVDADLVLTGQQLVVRLNASGQGAIRLAADSDGFRQHLEAAGLQLAGLTVRATDSLADAIAFNEVLPEGPSEFSTDAASASGSVNGTGGSRL
ncbi:flagellar hook-length control protein FliK [Caballeronia sp.]|uniref:flagellar hook-length control protein FliK n=1 Tax=Caballeronia sp. TaxID=1931223 RepID=UPI003C5A6358